VQGNHGTFPTDAQWNQKVIDPCHKIAKKEKIQQRQTDAKASKELVRQTFNPDFFFRNGQEPLPGLEIVSFQGVSLLATFFLNQHPSPQILFVV